jgi:serine/threonine protein kinase
VETTQGEGEAASPFIVDRGTRNDRFRLEGEIARGGMGVVMRAVDDRIRREIAVKYLLDQDNPTKKLRFVEEAQITGQLEHPNIVPIHELGADADGRLMFTMKMVKGRTLAQVLAREDGDGTLDKDDAAHIGSIAAGGSALNRLLTILINVCNALAYAHARGVIHRDLKPANIMVGDFGEVYVMDWGLAKVLSAAPENESSAAAGNPPALADKHEPDVDNRLPTVAAEAGRGPTPTGKPSLCPTKEPRLQVRPGRLRASKRDSQGLSASLQTGCCKQNRRRTARSSVRPCTWRRSRQRDRSKPWTSAAISMPWAPFCTRY